MSQSLSSTEQTSIIEDAVRLAEQRSPHDEVYGIPAPSIEAPELQRPDGWAIIGWVQVWRAMSIDSFLIGWNRETGQTTIRKGWPVDEAA